MIKPVAPLALRLQAMLLRGIVLLYNRQLVLLYGVWATEACPDPVFHARLLSRALAVGR